MIARTNGSRKTESDSAWQDGFVAMLPEIIRSLNTAFHNLSPEERTEAIQEAVVNAMVAYVALHRRGKVDLAYPSVLARYAIKHFRAGRLVATKSNCRDVLSPYARRMKSIPVRSLSDYDRDGKVWHEILVEDRRAGPADTAAARIDFADWFASLREHNRQVAGALADGSGTRDVARRFHVSASRISQMRREFLESWQNFHGG